MGDFKFEELQVYQKSLILIDNVYLKTRDFQKKKFTDSPLNFEELQLL